MKAKKYVVYTALFGEYDDLTEPVFSEECDYICFTDNPNLRSNGWKIVLTASHMTPQMMNRLYKIKPHLCLPDYPASLYVDSNIEVMGDPADLFCNYLSVSSFAAPRHAERNCIYSEALCCIAYKKTERRLVMQQMASYARAGYPVDNSLFENRILLRAHNDKRVIQLMDCWWDELVRWAERDQLSLCYVAWKLNFGIGEISENPRFDNRYFKWHPHKGDRKGLWMRLGRKLMACARYIVSFPEYVCRIWIVSAFFNWKARKRPSSD